MQHEIRNVTNSSINPHESCDMTQVTINLLMYTTESESSHNFYSHQSCPESNSCAGKISKSQETWPTNQQELLSSAQSSKGHNLKVFHNTWHNKTSENHQPTAIPERLYYYYYYTFSCSPTFSSRSRHLMSWLKSQLSPEKK